MILRIPRLMIIGKYPAIEASWQINATHITGKSWGCLLAVLFDHSLYIYGLQPIYGHF